MSRKVKDIFTKKNAEIITCIELPKMQFKTRDEMFKALVQNESKIIEVKKNAKKWSDKIAINILEEVTKGVLEGVEDGFYYPVINTTNIMDSHNDVHIPGIWKKSIKEQAGKVSYLINHDYSVGSIISFPRDVEMFTKELSWKDLGINKEGKTEALIYKIKPDSTAPSQAVKIIEERIPINHSVRMEYVKYSLAVNSEDKEFRKNKKTWDKYIDQIVNKERAEELGYFWAQEEAKVLKEGSMVIDGSNPITPMMYATKDIEPEESTLEIEEVPEESTHKVSKVDFLRNFAKSCNKQ